MNQVRYFKSNIILIEMDFQDLATMILARITEHVVPLDLLQLSSVIVLVNGEGNIVNYVRNIIQYNLKSCYYTFLSVLYFLIYLSLIFLCS